MSFYARGDVCMNQSKDGFASEVFCGCRVKALGVCALRRAVQCGFVMEEIKCTKHVEEEAEPRALPKALTPQFLRINYAAYIYLLI